MFHVLTEQAIPTTLYSGCTTSLIDGVYQNLREDSNSVMCGAGVGMRREAISHKDFLTYSNAGKLHTKQMCRACARSLRLNLEPRKKKKDVTD